MIRTALDKPQDKEIACMICQEPIQVSHHYIEVLEKWMHATVHQRCLENWDVRQGIKKQPQHEVPERFRDFELELLPDQQAARAASNFGPDAQYHTLAIIGPRGNGKSRLMWKVIQAFHEDLGGGGWPEYATFADVMTDFSRTLITRLKIARYVFIDDIGSTESFGHARAQLQNVIRARVQKGHWTFLTIDDPAFDPGFEDLFRHRAVVIYVS